VVQYCDGVRGALTIQDLLDPLRVLYDSMFLWSAILRKSHQSKNYTVDNGGFVPRISISCF